MKEKSLLLFDLDGVLLDSESDLSWLENSIRKTLGYFNIPITDEHMRHLHFENVEKFKKISQDLGIDPKVLWPIRNKYYTKEKIYAMRHRIIEPFDDVNVLYKIKDFFIFGIISNSPQEVVNFFVSEFNFSGLFKLNIGRGNTIWDIEHLKPDPYLFLKVKNQIKEKRIIYVGDRTSDREFAQRTGMIYYNVEREENHSNSFSNLADLVNFFSNI